MCTLQDSIDLVAGHYQVTPGVPSPLQLSLGDTIAVSGILVTSEKSDYSDRGSTDIQEFMMIDSLICVLQLPGALAALMAGAYFTSISARQCKA